MKNYSFLFLMCLAFEASFVRAMDNALARLNSNADQDIMRDSRALLTPTGRERTYEEIERSPNVHQQDSKLQRSSTEILCINAKKMATEARKKRATIIDYSRKQLDIKIQLLTAQKQIERQIELLKTVTEETKEAAKEQLKAYMSEAYIAIEKANAPQEEDIAFTNATLASIQAADEADRMMLEDLEAQVSETGNSNSNNNSTNTKSSAVAKKSTPIPHDNIEVNAVIAQVDEIYERVERRREARMQLSPRAEKIKVIMEEVEQKAQERPDISYEILLEYIQTHKELFLSKMHGENNAGLHTGIQRIIVHSKHPLDYILFAAMLECGVDRTLVYNGKTLLDAALDSGNQMLVQLLTTERPTKQTLIDLAYEHHRDDLIPYLLSEEECFQRACQDIDSGANNNNSNT